MTLLNFKPLKPSPAMFGDVIEEMFNTLVKDDNSLFKYTKPAVNILEDEKSFKLELALPGIKKEKIDIQIDDKKLVVSSVNEQNGETKNENFVRMEYNYSEFKRVFTLPESVNIDEIKADYNDGILNITLNKRDEALKKGTKNIMVN